MIKFFINFFFFHDLFWINFIELISKYLFDFSWSDWRNFGTRLLCDAYVFGIYLDENRDFTTAHLILSDYIRAGWLNDLVIKRGQFNEIVPLNWTRCISHRELAIIEYHDRFQPRDPLRFNYGYYCKVMHNVRWLEEGMSSHEYDCIGISTVALTISTFVFIFSFFY